MSKNPTYNFVLAIIFFICLLGTGASFLLQYVFNYNPCPLCIFQRIAVMTTGLVAFILLLIPQQKNITKIISAVLILIPSAFGITSAVRQIYLQHLPADQVPSCGPGLNFLVENNSYFTVLQKVFNGSGKCAVVEKLFYVPLPVWSLIMFIVIVLLAILGIYFTDKGQTYYK
ncbi:disulfide bond formation protein B [Neisseriaceae bacterium PsAf]|nr:disulfide bond formation protein B [Neisseriaceae bacterium PsAf]